MEKFKFRAECLRDVEELVRVINHNEMVVEIRFFRVADVEVILTTNLSLEEIINTTFEIDDLHVIRESVQLLEMYTGERDTARSL